jgi:hypothetical protein
MSAVHGQCWVVVRKGSITGPILLERVLEKGSSVTLRGVSLWVRFGSAGNLAVALNGLPARIPTGTYDALVDVHGFRPTTAG